ncbi:DNA-binding transcriptional MerR regulator [Elusimicrobium simillimum]|uniref:MerR family transcriptional regulator n=1 Tax=Elusimicrobium simillimum TaxID=3143438 RepID=UPI003C6F92CE
MGLEELQEKEYFTIGDVKRICGVPEYSVRYWEAEFGLIKPVRKASGHRRYTRADIETILKIKDLIYRQKMTLEGAKKTLSSRAKGGSETAKSDTRILKEIHETLSQILKEW